MTYAADVAAILHARCSPCHRPGQVAPFSLLTYDQARRWAASIAEVIADGRMPPWHADPRYGHFANDRSLSSRERSLLAAWIEQGTPSGDLSRAPEPPKYPQGWSIGTPDLVYEMPEPFLVPAEGTLPIQHFRLPTHLKEDLWIQAAEVRPSDRAVVHHIFVYMESRQDAKNKQKGVPRRVHARRRALGLSARGCQEDLPRIGPDFRGPLHADRPGALRPFFGRRDLPKQPPRHLAITRGIPQHKLRIPPGATDHVERVDWTIKSDIHFLSFTPHMHLRGKSFTYTAQYPDGRDEILLSVPELRLQLAERLPARRAETACPRERRSTARPTSITRRRTPPIPTRTMTVIWGEQTWDEMIIGYLDYFKDEPIVAGANIQPAGP